jgi:hypothetical protein
MNSIQMSLKGALHSIPNSTMSNDPTTITLTNAVLPTQPMIMGSHVATKSGAFILKGFMSFSGSTEARFRITHSTASSTTISTTYNINKPYMVINIVKQVTAGDTITMDRSGTAAMTIPNGSISFYFVESQ